jgi:hypothetical protein
VRFLAVLPPLLVACGDPPAPADDEDPAPPRTVYLVSSDGADAGTIAAIVLPEREVIEDPIDRDIGGDPVARAIWSDELFVLDRETGTISTLTEERHAVPTAPSPQDVVPWGDDKLLVPTLGAPGLYVIDRVSGEVTAITLGLAPMCTTAWPGDLGWIVCAGLGEPGTAQMVEIDAATGVGETVTLPLGTPFGPVVRRYLSLAPAPDEPGTGCLATTSGACDRWNDDLGGIVMRIHDDGDDAPLHLLVDGQVVRMDKNPTRTITPLTDPTRVLTDFAYCAPYLVVVDETAFPEVVRVYTVDGNALVTVGTVDVGLPVTGPYALWCG